MATLKKIKEEAVISGVCAGIAYNMGLNVSVVRLMYVIFTFCSFGLAILIYFLLATFLDEYETKPDDYDIKTK